MNELSPRPTAAPTAPDATFNTITANRIVIPYPDGRPAIELKFNRCGGPAVELHGRNQSISMLIEFDDEGETSGVHLDFKGDGVVFMSSDPQGHPGVSLHDREKMSILSADALNLTNTAEGNRKTRACLELTGDEGDGAVAPSLSMTTDEGDQMHLIPVGLHIADEKWEVTVGLENGPDIRVEKRLK